jgi:hypothetical protein
VQSSGWGELKNASHQGIDYKEKNKLYHESGLIVNNIVRFNYLKMFYLGIGAGAFYRYGNYEYDAIRNNLAIKLSIIISLK